MEKKMTEAGWKKINSQLEKISKEEVSEWMRKKAQMQAECGNKGHPGEQMIGGRESARIWCVCNVCGASYDRPRTEQETKDWYNLINTPFSNSIYGVGA